MNASARYTTTELKPGFGAEIHGIDLATATNEDRAAVVAEFHRSGAVRPATAASY